MKPQVFRSKTAWVLGWIWIVFAAVNAVDLIRRGRLPSGLIAGAVLGVLTVIVFITCLRPGLVLGEHGVLVRNPLRNAFIPWKAVDHVRVSHAIIIQSGDRNVRCWTPQSSARERARAVRRGGPAAMSRQGRYPSSEVKLPKAQQAAAEAFTGRTHADWVAQQISETAASRSRTASGDGQALTMAWSPAALSAAALGLILVIAAVISGAAA